MEHYEKNCMSEEVIPDRISQDPINILFNKSKIDKKNIWDIDLIAILNLLVKVLKKNGEKDFRVAGVAALASAEIYKRKVDSISNFQKIAMEKKPILQRKDVNIELINIPYRQESTYPVTLDELLGLLENLIGSIANPQSRRTKIFEPIVAPDFDDYFISLENIIGKYEDLIIKKITAAGFGMLQDIIVELDTVDSIRCFFASLFLARDGRVDLQQVDQDIKIILIEKTADSDEIGKN